MKAEIKGSLDVEALKQRVRGALAGLNIREPKIEDLCERVLKAPDPNVTWAGILSELEKLALHNTTGTDPIPATPVIDGCGFIASEKTRVAVGFNAAKWLELSVTELEFNPVFEY